MITLNYRKNTNHFHTAKQLISAEFFLQQAAGGLPFEGGMQPPGLVTFQQTQGLPGILKKSSPNPKSFLPLLPELRVFPFFEKMSHFYPLVFAG